MKPHRLIIHIRKRRIIIHPPARHQRGNRKHIREGPDRGSEEGNSSAAEPPVGGLVVGVGAHVDAPFRGFVGGGEGEAAALGSEGRRVFGGGGVGVAAAAGGGDGVGGGGGGHGVYTFVLFIYLYRCSGWACTMGLGRRHKQAFRASPRGCEDGGWDS